MPVRICCGATIFRMGAESLCWLSSRDAQSAILHGMGVETPRAFWLLFAANRLVGSMLVDDLSVGGEVAMLGREFANVAATVGLPPRTFRRK